MDEASDRSTSVDLISGSEEKRGVVSASSVSPSSWIAEAASGLCVLALKVVIRSVVNDSRGTFTRASGVEPIGGREASETPHFLSNA